MKTFLSPVLKIIIVENLKEHFKNKKKILMTVINS